MSKTTPALEVAETVAPPPRKKRGKPVAVETHKVERVWTEDVVIDNKPKPAPKRKAAEVEPDEDEIEIDEKYSDLPDDLAAFLQTNSGQRDVTMEVRRIDGPRTDVMPGIRAGVYINNHRFDPETYLDDLSIHYAEPQKDTRFLLRLKCNGQYVPDGTIYPVDVVGASVERKASVGVVVQQPQANVVATINQATPPMTMQPYEPPDPMAGINQTLNLLEKFQAIGLIPKLERGKPEQVIQQNPQQLSEEDILVRAALSSPEARERVSNGLLGKLLGDGALAAAKEEAPYWFEPAFSVVTNLIQGLTPGINSLLQVTAQARAMELQRAAQPQSPPASLPEGVQGQQPPPNFQPEPSVPQQESSHEPMQQPQPEDILFAQIFMACQRRKLVKPEVCAKGVLDLVDAHSAENGYSPFTNAVDIFLSADVADIVTFAATQNPIAAKMASEPDVLPWLKSVQDEIRKEWANDGSEQENP